jgi:defect in organelle trafficking protein DotC
MNRYLTTILTTASMALLVTGCATTKPRPVNTMTLHDIQQLTASNTPQARLGSIGQIRLEALKEAATTLGAQGGLAWRSKQIDKTLKEETDNLDRVFNFRALLLNHNVLPPVLTEGDQLLNLANPDTIRLANKTYKIIAQARFVTAPPNWRSYLWMSYKKPAVPDKTLLPRDAQEQRIWIKHIDNGWKKGIVQANNIYQDNLARLKRDYNGIILYRELLDRNIVSKPYVAASNLGVTSNNDQTQLYINDQVLRITALPKLNPKSKTWKPVITP